MIIDKNRQYEAIDFQKGVTVLIDKPLEWTSFDVVNKIRFALKRKLNVKKIKVGHAGTLDPLATGLLIVAIGKNTKLIDEYQNLDKVYTGSMKLGATTPSFDAEFEPDCTYPTEHITDELLEETRRSFIGEIEQIPPKYSAVKIDGVSAYKLARKGVDFEIKKRKVNIYKFDLKRKENDEVDFLVECQKGTYIRSLANDFGEKLNSGAYLSGLRRISIGQYSVDNAFLIDDFIKFIENI